MLVGAIHDAPTFEDGQVVGAHKELTITATIDHRFIDGFQGGVLAQVTRDLLEHPWKLDGLDGPPAPPTGDPAASDAEPNDAEPAARAD